MKIKQPFAQTERPTALLNSAQGNRKTLGVTKHHKLASGTFRSRAEKYGWVRGSVVDAGGISSYYKCFHGAMVTVFFAY